MSDQKVVKKQKTFSLPEEVSNALEKFFEDNRDTLRKMGVTNKTQLMTALIENGYPHVIKYLEAIKQEHQ